MSDHASIDSRPGTPPDPLAWLAAFRTQHPDVDIHADSLGVWFADTPAWRVYGRTLAEFAAKLRDCFT